MRKRAQAALARAKSMAFQVRAEKYIASHKAGRKNDKHAAQWPTTLTIYAYPVMGGFAAQNIDTALVACRALFVSSDLIEIGSERSPCDAQEKV